MNDDAERIRRQMQNVRQELGADVKGIVHGTQQLTDWHYYVRKHPWACVTGAFALGFLAAPGRAKAIAGGLDLDRLIAHMKQQGMAVGGGKAAASLLPGGMLGRILATAGPLVARSAINAIARRLAAGNDQPAEITPSYPEAP
jgi:hypothetical protein